MKYRFTIEGITDLTVAVQFYDDQRFGLGAEFAVEVGLAIGRVLDSPDLWPEIDPGFRKYRLNRFPCVLIYRKPTPRLIEIVSVFDLRRNRGRGGGEALSRPAS